MPYRPKDIEEAQLEFDWLPTQIAINSVAYHVIFYGPVNLFKINIVT